MTPPARDVVLQISALSLDGFIALENTEFDERASKLIDPQRDQWMVDSINRADVHIMGRVTYQAMANWWPSSTEIFAEPMNRIPKVVFSASLRSAPWGEGTRIVRGGIAAEIAALKAEPGSGEVLAHGGAKFDQSLAGADLVDEYRLIVYPFVIGCGTPLFAGVTTPRHLELKDAVPFPSGCVAMVYRRRSTISHLE
ncbi:MAG: dihydrofolate reductase family protein [Propionibacteriales bacterium]|nr:dihydrofolate reductase family protein [Propionibacteriales bacterium]